MKRIVADGHEVANHSWSHPQLTSMSEGSVREQLQKTHDAILAACGVTPKVMRPPYGAFTARQRAWANGEWGYKCILWDVDPLDWKVRNAEHVKNEILKQTVPGSIILSHDIHKTTIDAMPETLDGLLAKGFKFVTVSELIAMDARAAEAEGHAGTEDRRARQRKSGTGRYSRARGQAEALTGSALLGEAGETAAARDGVRHEHGDGHRADAAGDGGDGAALRGDFGEGDVADEPVAFRRGGIVHAVDADVDDDGAVASPSPRVTNSGRPMAAMRMSALRQTAARSRVREWATVTVASPPRPLFMRRSAIGLPTIMRAAEDDDIRAGGLDAAFDEQPLAAERGAGHEAVGVAERELARR